MRKAEGRRRGGGGGVRGRACQVVSVISTWPDRVWSMLSLSSFPSCLCRMCCLALSSCVSHGRESNVRVRLTSALVYVFFLILFCLTVLVCHVMGYYTFCGGIFRSSFSPSLRHCQNPFLLYFSLLGTLIHFSLPLLRQLSPSSLSFPIAPTTPLSSYFAEV